MATPTPLIEQPFWLSDITAEQTGSRILGGYITYRDEQATRHVLPVKVIANLSDVRCPRIVVRFPLEELVGRQFHELTAEQSTVMTSLLLPAIMETGSALGAKLVNVRIEGNVAMRPGSPEPITPHMHIVLRGVTNIPGVTAVFSDPAVGNDYPLATGKVGVIKGPATGDGLSVDLAAMSQFSKLFAARLSQALAKRHACKIFAQFDLNNLQFFL